MRILLRLLLFLELACPAFAQTYTLWNSPHQQFFDNSGRPLAGGKLYSYQLGTRTNQATYQDPNGTTANTNPIILDSGGFCTVYLNTQWGYTFRMTNAQGVQQWSVDQPAGLGTILAVPISALTAATATNTIDNGNQEQDWHWLLSGTAGMDGLGISETAPSTNTNSGTALMAVGTLAGSTISPFEAFAHSLAAGLRITPTGDISALGSATFIGPFRATNITGSTQCVQADAQGNLTGAGGVCETSTSFASPPPLGNVTPNTVAGTTGTFTGVNATTVTTTGKVTGNGITISGLTGTPQCLEVDVSGNIIGAGGLCGTSSGNTPISALASALSTNTLSNGNFTQTWNWGLTGATNGLVIGESSAGTGTGVLFEINPLSSNVVPFGIAGVATIARSTDNTYTHFYLWPGNSLQGDLLATTSGNVNLAGGAYINRSTNTWLATQSSASLFGAGPSWGPGFGFYSSSGLTSGSTFTPSLIAQFSPSNFVFNGAATLSNVSGIQITGQPFVSYPGTMYVMGGGHYVAGTGWVADSSGAANITAQTNGYVVFYSNTGLSAGTSFGPKQVAYIDYNGGIVGNALVSSGNTTTGSLTVNSNSSVAGTETTARLSVTGGINNSGGLQHMRVTSCSIPASGSGSNCSGTANWPVAFADAAYTAVCQATGDTNGAPVDIQLNAISAGSIGYNVTNLGAGAVVVTTTMHCIAIHD